MATYEDIAKEFVKIAENSTAHIIKDEVSDTIKKKNCRVLRYDGESFLTEIYFVGENQDLTYELYNKSGEILSAGDYAWVEYTGNPANGYIAGKHGRTTPIIGGFTGEGKPMASVMYVKPLTLNRWTTSQGTGVTVRRSEDIKINIQNNSATPAFVQFSISMRLDAQWQNPAIDLLAGQGALRIRRNWGGSGNLFFQSVSWPPFFRQQIFNNPFSHTFVTFTSGITPLNIAPGNSVIWFEIDLPAPFPYGSRNGLTILSLIQPTILIMGRGISVNDEPFLVWGGAGGGGAGTPGAPGQSPHIADGFWHVGTYNTGVRAAAQDGQNGKDGQNGLSAAQVAILGGWQGTEYEYNQELKNLGNLRGVLEQIAVERL